MGDGLAQTASTFCGLGQDWSTADAQESPFGVVVVLDETVSQKMNSSSVFYVVQPLGNQLVGFRAE